ncbi:NAD(P)H-dependent oxidoreductase [Gelidibacter salicanalis]|uniref:NAD(P)H-dependent oxidoreductase n=1 Tax=Gelidibacter salicanalis TaxID=291193 RepID=A0A934NJI6_9FLAO|nr:NAD(P)H-dependent oxidoreductase [Gelidibacter salicanalis]MBJ7882643.1 NAD(P)H-dependent oxidoreductase [Gelidibacter salicanalis]
MDIIQSLQWRYATKKFDPNKNLTQEKLHTLKEAFNLTATSFGLQTISLLIIENKQLREKLLPAAYHQRQIVEASRLLVLCIKDHINTADVDDLFDNVSELRNTPETILEPYRNDLKSMMKNMTQVEQQEWSIKQAYIALGNLMTVCAVERIDSCPMEGFERAQYDAILSLKEKGLKSVLLLPVGYRAEDDIFSSFKKVRKNLNDAVLEM